MPFHIRQAVPYSSEATLEQFKKYVFMTLLNSAEKEKGREGRKIGRASCRERV